jgi:hypothetical protein
MFLRNCGSFKRHTASHPRRLYSSVTAVKTSDLRSGSFCPEAKPTATQAPVRFHVAVGSTRQAHRL